MNQIPYILKNDIFIFLAVGLTALICIFLFKNCGGENTSKDNQEQANEFLEDQILEEQKRKFLEVMDNLKNKRISNSASAIFFNTR